MKTDELQLPTGVWQKWRPESSGQCSADTFVVNQSLVLRINICGASPALRVAAER